MSRTFTENNSYVMYILNGGYQDINCLISQTDNHDTQIFQCYLGDSELPSLEPRCRRLSDCHVSFTHDYRLGVTVHVYHVPV